MITKKHAGLKLYGIWLHGLFANGYWFYTYMVCSVEDQKFIAARQGSFIVPYVWKIVVRKNLTNFGGCHWAQFHILIWWIFSKIETRNFNSGSCFFKLVKLGTISPAAYFVNCVHIERSQMIAAIICGISSGKRFVKLREDFLSFLNYKHKKKL